MRLTILLVCLGVVAAACGIDAAEIAGAAPPSTQAFDAGESSDTPAPAEAVLGDDMTAEATDGSFCQAAEAAFNYSELIDGQVFSGPAPPEMVEYSELVHEAAVLAPSQVAEWYELLDDFTAEAASESPRVMEPKEIRAVFGGLPVAALFVQGECGFNMMEAG